MIKQALLLTVLLITTVCSAAESNKASFKTATEVIQALKASPEKAVEGPFRLKVMSMSKSGFNTRLHTQETPSDADELIIEIPPFMAQYYTKQFNTTLENFFLNQTFSVNGKAHAIKVKNDDKDRTEYIIKIYLANQMAHLQ